MSNDDSLLNVSTGSYFVEIMDANGCDTFTTVQVISSQLPLTASPQVYGVSCRGDSTGMIIADGGGSTDSGLDIDALKIVANGVNSLKSSSNSIILITHYQRLLNYIVPDFVHILKDGKIVMSGDKSLAQKLEKEGYSFLN